MANLTRQQMITMAMNLNDETEDKPGFNTAAFIYNQLIDSETDLLCELDCLYLSYTADLINGQSSYSIPAIYRTGSIVAMWSNGVTKPLAQLTPQDMDQQYPTWRTQPAQGWPTTAVFDGQTSLILYPQPNYQLGSGAVITITNTAGALTYAVAAGGSGYLSPTFSIADPTGSGATCILGVTNGVITSASGAPGSGYTAPVGTIHTGGLTIEGFAVPSTAAVGGTNLWPLPTSKFPLPQVNACQCVVYSVAALRCAQHPDGPGNTVRYPLWAAQAKKLRGKVFKEVTESNSGRRAGDAPETTTSSFAGSF